MSLRIFPLLIALLLTAAAAPTSAQTLSPGQVPAKPKSDAPLPYPEAMKARKLTGKVAYLCAVDASGQMSNLHIMAATYVDFVPDALKALRTLQFDPATQDGKPVPSRYSGSILFADPAADRKAVLAANQVTGSDGQPPAFPPMPYEVVDPVFPSARLLAGESGEAIAVFVVQPNGFVGEIQVRSATKPEYGDALRAALEAWVFRPALKDGQPTAVTLAKRVNFRGVPKNSPGTQDALTRVVVAARQDKIGSAKGLDHPLTPIYQVTPNYPAALANTSREAGEALLSMVICRDGRVRLVQAISASQPAFAWAAVTAVNQWLFEPPTRGGEPVDVRVQIPIRFGAAKK